MFRIKKYYFVTYTRLLDGVISHTVLDLYDPDVIYLYFGSRLISASKISKRVFKKLKKVFYNSTAIYVEKTCKS